MSTITPYEELPQSYIVFICTFNPFESGRHLYTFENLCAEEPTLRLDDKMQKVFLCTEGDKNDVGQEIMEFLDYVAGRKLEGKLAKELDSEVKNAREKEEWRAEYMQNMAAIMDAKREGKAEGKAEGMDNLSKLINHLAKQGLTDEILKVTSDETYRDQMLKTLNLV